MHAQPNTHTHRERERERYIYAYTNTSNPNLALESSSHAATTQSNGMAKNPLICLGLADLGVRDLAAHG
jgi:hypothetical protein